MCRGGGSRAQGLVRAGVVPTTPWSLERVRRGLQMTGARTEMKCEIENLLASALEAAEVMNRTG